jgi:hypothetical protein
MARVVRRYAQQSSSGSCAVGLPAAQHERPRPPPRLCPGKPARDPPHELIEYPGRLALWRAATARSSRVVTNQDD